MKPIRLPAVILAFVISFATAPAQEKGWTPLFNGKDLTGWTPKIVGFPVGVNHADTFRVENGVLKVSYSGYERFDGKFGHLFYKAPFSHYRLRVEYRFLGEQCPGGPGWAFRNSGIMIHCQTPESMQREQPFPVSLEVQLLGGRPAGERSTANLCTPGTNYETLAGKLITAHCTNSSSETYRGDQWVTVEVEVRGDKLIKHMVEGKTVLEYAKPQLDPEDEYARPMINQQNGSLTLTGGYIALQAESHPCEFRKVEIMVLAD